MVDLVEVEDEMAVEAVLAVEVGLALMGPYIQVVVAVVVLEQKMREALKMMEVKVGEVEEVAEVLMTVRYERCHLNPKPRYRIYYLSLKSLEVSSRPSGREVYTKHDVALEGCIYHAF